MGPRTPTPPARRHAGALAPSQVTVARRRPAAHDVLPAPSSTDQSRPAARVTTRSPVCCHPGRESSTTTSHPSPAAVPLGRNQRVPLAGHRVPGPCTSSAAVSTAAATSPSGGNSSARPTTRPRTGGQLERLAPRGVGVLRVALRVAAQQQRGQRRRLHHPRHARRRPAASARCRHCCARARRRCAWTGSPRSGSRRLRHPAVDGDGHERLDHRHQPVLGELGSRPGRCLQGRDRARVVEADAGQHLAAVEAPCRDRRRRRRP